MEADPHEARLFQMFKSCDKDNTGLLDEDGIRQLVLVLELEDKEEQFSDLLGKKQAKISFEIFKECLLNFLGGSNDTESTSGYLNCQRTLVFDDNHVSKPQQCLESPPESSDREVSPKLVMGSKKYGRRSRPPYRCSKETLLSDSDDDCVLVDGSHRLSKAVERSSSQTDIASNRRWCATEQSGTKLKRCASLPAQRYVQNQVQVTSGCGSQNNNSKAFSNHRSTKNSLQKNALKTKGDTLTQTQLNSSVESLGHETLSRTIRDVWQNYSAEIGSSYLTCTQLRVICERLGLKSTLAERVACESFEQLHSCQQHYQLITMQDFIKLLTSSKSSSTMPVATTTITIDAVVDQSHEIFDSNEMSTKESSTHMETLPADDIIDIWERANIPNGKNILLALGFDELEVRLTHLHKVIDEEVRGLEEEQAITLLRASSTLQNVELTSVRQLLRQVHDENVKLRADNKEANQRVALMALEIDERHAMLEENSKKEVKTLEQRHASAIRELTTRMANDREHWSNLITKLEDRLKKFEQDESRLKTEIDSLRKENEELESKQLKLLKENESLIRSVAELSTQTTQKNETLQHSNKSAGHNATDDDDDEVLVLIQKVEALRMENHSLRDKNDELVVEVENLNMELQRFKAESKKRTLLATSTTTTASYNASSNLNQSENDSSLEETGNENVATATKRRGDSPSKAHVTEESPRTGKLRKCGNDDDDNSIDEMALNAELHQQKCKKEGKSDIVSALRERVDELEKLLKSQAASDEASASITCNGEKCEHASYVDRCKELETSLEQMGAAYDDCEKYWQSKVNDERQTVEELQIKLKTERELFDEQRMFYDDVKQESDRKFTELMEKIREYEEQFTKDSRLSPIEERDMLEQQYAELEAELKTERDTNDLQTKEIENLKNEIDALRNQIENQIESLHEFIITDECEFPQRAGQQQQPDTRNESSASSPISYLWHQSTIQQPAKLTDENNKPISVTASNSGSPNRHRNCITLSTTELSTFSTPPNTSTSSSTSQQACISPIQKPAPKALATETDDNGAAGDCDTTSTASRKSLETQSVVSTQSEKGAQAQSETAAASNDEKRSRSPASFREELKRLKYLEISLKEQIKDLSFQRDGLVMELQQLHEARPVLEKAYARTAHPNLTQRISQLELRNRHLQNVIKQQQQYTESMMQQSWRQYQTEMNDLHGRLDAQVAMISDQGQRLQNADMLVKDLYVENAHLTATVQRLEQQRLRISMMHQHQQHQLQGLNTLPGMP